MSIHFEGVDKLVTKMEKLKKLNTVVAYLKAAADFIKTKVETPPPVFRPTRKSVYGKTWKSPEQAVFMREEKGWFQPGGWAVPYHRGESEGSKALNRSWSVEDSDGGLTQTIGTSVSYAPYVMGEKQSLYMQAVGWQKVSDIADDNADRIVEKITSGLEAELSESEE